MTPHPTEHQIQTAFVKYCHAIEHLYPGLRLAYAVPNGGKRDVRVAMKMKAEGVRKGVPDWMLPLPRGGFNGLAIEFKSLKGRATPEQIQYMHDLAVMGNWFVVSCKTLDSAMLTLDQYLKLGN